MSGPKVVRVVTREERVAIAEAQLRRLDRAIADWEATLKQLGDADEAVRAAVKARFKAFEALLRADSYSELQRDVPAEIAFLEGDGENRRMKAAEARAVQLTRVRQLKRNAAVLLEDIRTRSTAVDGAMVARLGEVANGQLVGAAAEACLAEAFRGAIKPAAPVSLTAAQREIAGRLLGGQEGQDFESWKAAHADADEPRILNLEKRLAELATYVSDDDIKLFTERLDALRQTSEGTGKNLKVDSLVVDLASAVVRAKADAAALKEGREVVAEIIALGVESGVDVQRIAADLTEALDNLEVAKLPALVASGRSALVAAEVSRAAAARRAAVLDGLKALGYDVREGMSTAWQEKGRLVVRRPGQHDFGVEISSAASGERMQVRAVAFSASRDTTRDASAETAWCGHFLTLQTMFAKQGGALNIEKANPIGALPLKVVDLGERSDDTQASSRARG